MDHKAAFQLRSGVRESAPMPDTNAHAGENLSDWLQEVAARPWVSGPPSINPASLPGTGLKAGPEPRRRRHFQNGRDVVALAALSIGYLQYYYLDVMVQIGSLHQVVIFVPLTAA
jgi:hypothetical protein